MKKPTMYDKAVFRYCAGTIIAALLTVAIYIITVGGFVMNPTILAITILIFALVQLLVQLFFFLHITDGPKPRWRVHTLLFVSGTIVIVVTGSIWIMKNLDYNMGMSSQQMQQYMLNENQKGF